VAYVLDLGSAAVGSRGMLHGRTYIGCLGTGT